MFFCTCRWWYYIVDTISYHYWPHLHRFCCRRAQSAGASSSSFWCIQFEAFSLSAFCFAASILRVASFKILPSLSSPLTMSVARSRMISSKAIWSSNPVRIKFWGSCLWICNCSASCNHEELFWPSDMTDSFSSGIDSVEIVCFLRFSSSLLFLSSKNLVRLIDNLACIW